MGQPEPKKDWILITTISYKFHKIYNTLTIKDFSLACSCIIGNSPYENRIVLTAPSLSQANNINSIHYKKHYPLLVFDLLTVLDVDILTDEIMYKVIQYFEIDSLNQHASKLLSTHI